MEDEKLRGNVDPLAELSGTALKLYLTLLRSDKPLGVRELQRRLGLRSPSTVRHHLERLERLGLVAREGDGYRAQPPRHGLLRLFIHFRGHLVPRTLALAAFTIAAAAAYTLLPGSDPVASTVMAVVAALLTLESIAELREVERLEKG